MKINLQREDLLKPLQMVMGVVERKQTMPMLSNVLLNFKDKTLSITGTDLEIELKGYIALSQPIQESHITLPGRKLADICRALPENATIELYKEDARVLLSSGQSRFTLATLPANEFPSTKPQESNLKFQIPENKFRYLLERTYFAMAQQDVRYYLNGLLLEINAQRLLAVATDGHRLTTNAINIDIQQHADVQIIVPRKGILELLRLLGEADTNITVSIATNHVQIYNEDFVFTSKLIDGRFPDYRRAIPKCGQKYLVLNRNDFKQALSRSAILCNEKFRGVRLELRKNLLRILASNPEQEVAEEELSVEYQQADLDVGFNVNYILDVLNVLETDSVKLNFSDANGSLVIEETDAEKDSTFVIMPMRL